MLERSKNRKAGKFIVIAMSILFIASLTGCQNNEIVAKGENISVTKEELYDSLVEHYGSQVLDSLIGEKMVKLEVEKENIEVKDEDIQAELDEIMAFYGGEESFNEVIESQGLTLEEMKENMIMNMKLKKLLEPNIEIGEEEVAAYFEQNKNQLNQPEQVSARHILVESKELSEEIKNKISEGSDFVELAKEYSIDESTKESGGDLGFFGRGKMVPSFEEVAFSLEKGEVSDPVKSDYGYHIIKVEDKKEATEANIEDYKDEIEAMLIEEKIPEAYQKWYETKYEEYEVTNSLS